MFDRRNHTPIKLENIFNERNVVKFVSPTVTI